MTRLRLAALLAAIVVFAGTTAAPSRVVESTRFRAALVWLLTDRSRPRVQPRTARRLIQFVAADIVFPRRAARPFRPSSLPHPLFQRPPPSFVLSA